MVASVGVGSCRYRPLGVPETEVGGGGSYVDLVFQLSLHTLSFARQALAVFSEAGQALHVTGSQRVLLRAGGSGAGM